jgi:NAD(P)-dependent dehydrogenase (short-subunit alcohol dehydrogenase family)
MEERVKMKQAINTQVVITGAGRGIGFDLCDVFSGLGHQVIAISRSEFPVSRSPLITSIKADISNPKPIVQEIEKRFLATDIDLRILVHNAGVLINKPFTDFSADEIATMYNVNYLSPLLLTQSLVPWLNAVPAAHVVYLGSMGGFQGSEKYPGLTIYGSMKAAGSNLMEGLAAEYRDTTLRFNSLSLGAVDTVMLRTAFDKEVTAVSIREMTNYISRFCLEAFRVVNGQNMPVTMRNP